ncbi:hypothetical protein NpPPO83_00000393 [Neofusicoccum parvum]|uniref:Uncharacterized protein n=1 Tax=Neofusicoccum parvum TaxID=310453 RepID=A0ACB5SMX8_9PEZI|nr:hypothetical protein NpPPO83_00000393 [Neofusicoccum parvum]
MDATIKHSSPQAAQPQEMTRRAEPVEAHHHTAQGTTATPPQHHHPRTPLAPQPRHPPTQAASPQPSISPQHPDPLQHESATPPAPPSPRPRTPPNHLAATNAHPPPEPPSPVPGFDRILRTFLSTRGAPAAARLHHYIEARGGSAAGLQVEILDLIERMLGEEEERAARPVEAGVRWWGERVELMRVERGVGDGLREEEEEWEEEDDDEEEEEEEECECENEAERTPYATSSARRGYENGLFRHFDLLAAYEEGVWKGEGRAYRTFLNPYNADYESPYYVTPLPHTHNPYIPTGPRGL